jgi:hypothetical protein
MDGGGVGRHYIRRLGKSQKFGRRGGYPGTRSSRGVRGGGRDPVWCSGLSEGVVEVAVISELMSGS